MNPSSVELFAAVVFALSILHIFSAGFFRKFGDRFKQGTVGENFFHLLGEVEVVFGLWAAIFVLGLSILTDVATSIHFLESRNFTEPLFVFAIMAICATRPVVGFAEMGIQLFAKQLPFKHSTSLYVSCLFLGPILGSLVTEPAAMTITALIFRDFYFSKNVSEKFKYITIGTLFVNISIGGVLTHFAAPPVLMVAESWGWGTLFMLKTFGWKAALATAINTIMAATLLQNELKALKVSVTKTKSVPPWVVILHLFFLMAVVMTSHHPSVFLGLFLFFLGVATITNEYQDELQIRQSLLVAFFLSGLVVLGGMQQWWLDPLIRSLDDTTLFLSTAALTAFTDNAALTYLGGQIQNSSEGFRYALMAGAIAGGGLTVIANAPNPAGYAILQSHYKKGIHPLKLFLAALLPTIVAMLCFWLL